MIKKNWDSKSLKMKFSREVYCDLKILKTAAFLV